MSQTCIEYFVTSTPTSIVEDSASEQYGQLLEEYHTVRGVKDVASTSSYIQNVPEFLVKKEDDFEDENVEDVVVVESQSVEDDATNSNTSGHLKLLIRSGHAESVRRFTIHLLAFIITRKHIPIYVHSPVYSVVKHLVLSIILFNIIKYILV